MTTTELAAKSDAAAILERLVVHGDLSKLDPQQRLSYYRQVCESLGLNPLTSPFQYVTLQGRLTLYATRNCTDQLRALHGVSVRIVSRERQDDLYIVTSQATMPDGRCDESAGAVAISGLRGEALANAIMKAETKSKRRVTLCVCGLGILDESEAPTVPGARVVPVDMQTGEILEQRNPEGDGGRVIGTRAAAVPDDDGLEPEGISDPELIAAIERWDLAVEAAEAARVAFKKPALKGKTAAEIDDYAQRLEGIVAGANR